MMKFVFLSILSTLLGEYLHICLYLLKRSPGEGMEDRKMVEASFQT